jgi:hypothetical protein
MGSLRNIKSVSTLNYTSEGSETAEIISAACKYVIRAATKTITFFCRLYETNSIQKVRYFLILSKLVSSR